MAEISDLPSVDELDKLSLRGNVAYCILAARRVWPFVSAELIHGRPHEDVDVIDGALALVERCVRGEDFQSIQRELSDAVAKGWSVQFEIESTFSAMRDSKVAAAFFGVRAARSAIELARAFERFHATMVEALAAASIFTGQDDIVLAARRDYERLLKLGHEPIPNEGEPIDLAALGGIWPNGEPTWYSAAIQNRGKRQ